MKIKPGQSKRMTRISREVLTYLRGIAARGGSARTPAKVAASKANMQAINARRAAKKLTFATDAEAKAAGAYVNDRYDAVLKKLAD